MTRYRIVCSAAEGGPWQGKTFLLLSFVYESLIHEYLRQTMAENVLYAGVWQDNKLLALASAEVDEKMANAEMTDFATHVNGRGRGLAGVLLQKLEVLMAEAHIKTCYTIARAISYGMNITFAKNMYTFAGTLINNTQISGSLESMNAWYKQGEKKF